MSTTEVTADVAYESPVECHVRRLNQPGGELAVFVPVRPVPPASAALTPEHVMSSLISACSDIRMKDAATLDRVFCKVLRSWNGCCWPD